MKQNFFGRIRRLLRAGGVLPATAEQRRDDLAKLRKSISHRLGIRAHNRNLIWFEDASFIELMRRFDPGYKQIKERHFELYQFARSVADLHGDTAECGVYLGISSHIIRSATEAHDRRHFLFDSFEGLSKPESRDRPTSSAIREWHSRDLAVDQQTVQDNLSGHSNLVFCKGWIPERFSDAEDQAFVLVHIDVDLYQPTLDSLRFFYPRLASGGIAICDDYGFSTCPGAYAAMNEYAEEIDASVVHLPTGHGVMFKR